MDAEERRKREAWFAGRLAPSRPFEQVNIRPIVKAIEANTAEVVARITGERYPSMDDL